MSADNIVIGYFQFVDDTIGAIRKLRERGLENFELFSPMPNHELEEEIYRPRKRSPIRMFTLLGGITGCLGAFLMTIWMSVDWPLRTSAKPIVSIPAFVIIGFECTILLGAIFTILGILHHCRLPNIFQNPAFRPEFTEGTFGLTVRVSKDSAAGIEQDFRSSGAEKVEVQYVR